ncbi:RagB/SusD family nutrient uptake outer membrane protein [Olivibacter sp. XZL3]|uniref:RagB/SusD family nutrient uptake outer membrane protein n=1 Tax=Olivibacter sp. XZL3 TaxID=1735116 RepID=UPI0014170AB7|nr:RagB/SusD family nutrient uptake outer membrane protein [Olivibacter sp. XZL3]
MNGKHLIGYLLLCTLTLASCSKSFLQEDPSTSVAVESAISSETDMLESVAGLYRSLDNYFIFGRNYPLFGDLLADNVYLSSTNSSRLLMQNNYTWTIANTEPRTFWSNTYYSILQANRIIGSNLDITENVAQLKGEAYALRALCYLYLINWFAKPYTVDPNAAGVPLVTVSTSITGPLVKPERNTVAEVYDKMISDLDSAFLLMPETTPAIHIASSNFIAKYAAKALQSRVFLYKADYENARDAALSVVQNGGYSLTDSPGDFAAYWASTASRTDKVETIFELNNSATANNGIEGLDFIYAAQGHGDMLVTDDTYAIYQETDSRRALIQDGTRNGMQAYFVNKYPNVTATDRDEVKMIRYAEVLLTLSEAYGRLGDEANARLYLNMVAQNRDHSIAPYTYSGNELLDAIVLERRKELAFEGLRFFDLTRLNLDFTRQNMGTKAYSYYTDVLRTDFRRIQPIPQEEINANPNMTQNAGY